MKDGRAQCWRCGLFRECRCFKPLVGSDQT